MSRPPRHAAEVTGEPPPPGDSSTSRSVRWLLGATVALTALLVGVADAQEAPRTTAKPARPHLAWALDVAKWLEQRAVRTEYGLAWPAGDPFPASRQPTTLYHGSSGVVLFFLEAHHATGDAKYLDVAKAGADHLVASLGATNAAAPAVNASLYSGLAGVGFTLWETHKRAGGKVYADAARQCLTRIHQSAQKSGAGLQWNAVTDIIGGSAGTGLFLLYAARHMDDRASIEVAAGAGRRLIEVGIAEHGGSRWPMAAGSPRNYPNFSHGTAGVCYFLAELHRATGEKTFRDAALAGARYLDAIGKDGLVFHHQPGGDDLYYLGWCHGPPGTTRLYQVLGEITGDPVWRKKIDAALAALMASGIPEKRPDGFWNNAGQCCGTAGVTELMLAQGRTTAHRALLQRLVRDLHQRATRDAEGARWVLAEHRVRPKLLGAQTGYTQGAAGIGLCMLHLDGAEVGRAAAIVLPDAPRRP